MGSISRPYAPKTTQIYRIGSIRCHFRSQRRQGITCQKAIDRKYSFEHFVVNDPSDDMFTIARQRLSDNPSISFNNHKVQHLSYPPNYFTEIICLNSFHFYKNQQQVLSQFHDILKPGGKLYILDWNREGLFRIFNQFIRWANSEYINTYSLRELKQMMSAQNFNIKISHSWNWRYWKFMLLEGVK